MIGRAIVEAAPGSRDARGRAIALCALLVGALLLLLGVSTNYWVGTTDSTGAGLHGITMLDNGWYREVRYGDVTAQWGILDTGGVIAVGATYAVIAAQLLLWVACFASNDGPRRVALVARWLALAAFVGGAVTTAGLARHFGAPIGTGAILYLGGAAMAIAAASRLARPAGADLPSAHALRA